MTRLIPYLLPLLLIGLTLLASSPHSHSQSGVLLLSAFSLFVSLGYLLFGARQLDPDSGHSA